MDEEAELEQDGDAGEGSGESDGSELAGSGKEDGEEDGDKEFGLEEI